MKKTWELRVPRHKHVKASRSAPAYPAASGWGVSLMMPDRRMLAAMDLPKMQPWVRWSRRGEIAERNLPGVYMLARFHGRPPRRADPAAKEIMYFGETCAQSLAARWYQFNRSAFLQKAGHSGGWTFAERYCANKVIEPFDWLYVSAYPVDLKEPRLSAHIRFVERWMIWRHVERHGRLPVCNRK